MNLDAPIDLAKVQKKFGPYINGPDGPDNTVSAVQFVPKKGKKEPSFLGVVGNVPREQGAKFWIHFPGPVRLSDLSITRKGTKTTPNCISGLREDGQQGDPRQIAEFEKAKRLIPDGHYEAKLSLRIGSGERSIPVRVQIKTATSKGRRKQTYVVVPVETAD